MEKFNKLSRAEMKKITGGENDAQAGCYASCGDSDPVFCSGGNQCQSADNVGCFTDTGDSFFCGNFTFGL